MRNLWLTYAWEDNSDGDFDYVVNALAASGCQVKYDKIQLIPGLRLWERIAGSILNGDYDGWGYLITPQSIDSEPCKEELAYALQRALITKGDFPLIGLLHHVSIGDVPPALRVRLCVNLKEPDWTEQVIAGLERRPPIRQPADVTKYRWSAHYGYGKIETRVALEVRPRFEELRNWRFLVPEDSQVVEFGYGAANGGLISGPGHLVVKGVLEMLNGKRASWYGQGDPLSPSTSGYIVFEDAYPSFVGFGVSHSPFDIPTEWEVLRRSDIKNLHS